MLKLSEVSEAEKRAWYEKNLDRQKDLDRHERREKALKSLFPRGWDRKII